MSSKNRLCAFALVTLLAGCASVSHSPPSETTLQPPPVPGSPYVAEPGRDAATIATMRAAPAPAVPELASGRNPAGDQNSLAAQGFVRIGTARYRLDEAAAKDEALRQGQRAGADRVLVYAPSGAAAAEWVAVYFVRFKLPFGATFRDLQAAERTTLGGGGVEIGSVVGGTPASRANLIAGDYVIALDGKPIVDRADFQERLKRSAGRTVTLTVIRNGESVQRAVRLGALPSGAQN